MDSVYIGNPGAHDNTLEGNIYDRDTLSASPEATRPYHLQTRRCWSMLKGTSMTTFTRL